MWCLTPDRLARNYAYQFLVTEELARFGVSVRYSDELVSRLEFGSGAVAMRYEPKR